MPQCTCWRERTVSSRARGITDQDRRRQTWKWDTGNRLARRLDALRGDHSEPLINEEPEQKSWRQKPQQ